MLTIYEKDWRNNTNYWWIPSGHLFFLLTFEILKQIFLLQLALKCGYGLAVLFGYGLWPGLNRSSWANAFNVISFSLQLNQAGLVSLFSCFSLLVPFLKMSGIKTQYHILLTDQGWWLNIGQWFTEHDLSKLRPWRYLPLEKKNTLRHPLVGWSAITCKRSEERL